MVESKIQTMRRLEREGRWEEASAAKDERIRQLRSEGMKKRDAGAQAWKWLSEEFAPLGQDEIISVKASTWLSAACFPPRDPNLGRQFEADWWCLTHQFAAHVYRSANKPRGAAICLGRMIAAAPSDIAREAGLRAVKSPERYLRSVRVRLRQLAEVFKQDETYAASLTPEFEAYLEMVNEMLEGSKCVSAR